MGGDGIGGEKKKEKRMKVNLMSLRMMTMKNWSKY